MLKRIRIENYRSIAEVDIELGPLTVLVGQNGSGKSNFVDAIHFLSDALTYGLDAAVARRGGIGSIRRRAPGRPATIRISTEWGHEDGSTFAEYVIDITGVGRGGYAVDREWLRSDLGDEPFELEVRRGTPTRASTPYLLITGGERDLATPAWPVVGAQAFVHEIARPSAFYSIRPDTMRGIALPLSA